jgi:hypothetical protein
MSEVKTAPTYKGKPLVRCGNTIYYGDMADKFVVKMEIRSTKKIGSTDAADKISVQLLTTDPNVRPKKQILKASERDGLYKALDVASFWLERAMEEA